MNSALNLIQLDSQGTTRGAINLLQSGYAADPRETVRNLVLDWVISGDALTTVTLETFAAGVFLNWKYIDGSQFINNVNASMMDFNAMARLSGVVPTGIGDWAAPGTATMTGGSLSLRQVIPIWDPRRRRANDSCFPVAELGQLQIQWNPAAVTLNGGTGIGNVVVTAYAVSTTEKKPKLGSRSKFEQFQLQSGVTTYAIGGMLPANLQAYYNNGQGLVSQIAGGFLLYFDSDVVLEGNYLNSLESLNSLVNELFYMPVTGINAFVALINNTATVPVDGAGWNSMFGKIPLRHARIWQCPAGLSATALTQVQQLRFQCNTPGANIKDVAFVLHSYYPNTPDFLAARKAKLGLQTMAAKLVVSDSNAPAPSPTEQLKLPAAVVTR